MARQCARAFPPKRTSATCVNGKLFRGQFSDGFNCYLNIFAARKYPPFPNCSNCSTPAATIFYSQKISKLLFSKNNSTNCSSCSNCSRGARAFCRRKPLAPGRWTTQSTSLPTDYCGHPVG